MFFEKHPPHRILIECTECIFLSEDGAKIQWPSTHVTHRTHVEPFSRSLSLQITVKTKRLKIKDYYVSLFRLSRNFVYDWIEKLIVRADSRVR